MRAQHLAIIDYGMGNLHSVASAVAHVAPELKVSITHDAATIAAADRIIFPGVGAIGDCIAEIKRLHCDQSLARARSQGTPILAICVGMQALMQGSEENGGVACLGMLPGAVQSFATNARFTAARAALHGRLKVPHMGWNQVVHTQAHPLWHNIAPNSRFYFVHSYYVSVATPDLCVGRSHFGIDFTAAIAQENLFAVQFHPEKSHTCGLQLLRNFVQWDGTLNSASHVL